MKKNKEFRQIHYNKPQIYSRMIDAKHERDLWGRATGKSSGRGSTRILDCLTKMPRCRGVNVASTFTQLLERTMPPIITHWQSLGMQRDVDFWVRKFPDKKHRYNMPYVMPEIPDYSIFVRVNKTDISVLAMVSQDRPASSSGLSVDFIFGDEARYLKHPKLEDELFPTNRGNDQYFKNCHLHHSTCFMSDMPKTKGSRWLIEDEKKMDKEAVKLIEAIQFEIYKVHLNASKKGIYSVEAHSKLKTYNNYLFSLRKDLWYYSEANTLENLEIVGSDFIESMRKSLSESEFNRAILNIRPNTVEQAFYPNLSDWHFYNNLDNSVIDGLSEHDYGKGNLDNCKKDADLDRTQRLYMGGDFGGSINCIAVGQIEGKHFNIIKEFLVLNPGRIKDLCGKINDYYSPGYFKKELTFYYDHTHKAANPVSDLCPSDEFIDNMRHLGWIVKPVYLGHTSTPYVRFWLWGLGLVGDDDRILKPRFNEYNTPNLRKSMELVCVIKNGATEYAKDKRGERNKDLDQTLEPHLSDAADTLYFGVCRDILDADEHSDVLYVIK